MVLPPPVTERCDTGVERTTPIPTELPLDMTFNDGHVVAIVGFSTLMLLSSIGNITVLYSILRSRTKSQINLMLSHLAVADLLVTFLMMPLEIGWAWTVQWKGGDVMCRLMSFFRAFGLYLSGFVVMCISIDRYCAVLHPLAVGAAEKRGRRLLALAWTVSFICSFPQALVFTAQQHPEHQWFTQCITYGVFKTHTQQVLYSVAGVVFMYILPLVTIVYCYSAIIMEICRRAIDTGEHKMRRSNSGNLCRAKVRTLKMTVTIVGVFILCWTPYYVMLIWYYIDRTGAYNLDPKVQRLLFLFACTNSSFNPLVYGVFNIRRRNQLPAAPLSSVMRSHAAMSGRPSPPRTCSARVMTLRDDARYTTARRPTV